MIINKTELERRLASSKNVVNKLDHTIVADKPKNGNGKVRGPAVPVSVKITAGALARQTNVKDVSAELGISPGVVRDSMNSTNPVVRQGVDTALDRVRELAIDKLMESLRLITPEKMDKTSAKELSTIAANMSRVVEKTSPREQNANVQLIVYAPQQREEKQYRVIDV